MSRETLNEIVWKLEENFIYSCKMGLPDEYLEGFDHALTILKQNLAKEEEWIQS